jgi:hypothetical protein
MPRGRFEDALPRHGDAFEVWVQGAGYGARCEPARLDWVQRGICQPRRRPWGLPRSGLVKSRSVAHESRPLVEWSFGGHRRLSHPRVHGHGERDRLATIPVAGPGPPRLINPRGIPRDEEGSQRGASHATGIVIGKTKSDPFDADADPKPRECGSCLRLFGPQGEP